MGQMRRVRSVPRFVAELHTMAPMHDVSNATGAASLRVMVVDDHDLFRSGLRRLLDEHDGLAVVAEARRGEEAVARAAELRPDVVVMDINMPGISGVEATRGVLDASPASAVLMLTVTSDESAVLDAVLAGRRATCSRTRRCRRSSAGSCPPRQVSR